MKKILSTLIVISAAMSAFAQTYNGPKLTGPNLNPVAGDKFFKRGCVRTGVSPGASGRDVIWDFRKLTVLSQSLDTVAYRECSKTDYCDSVHYATLGTKMSNGWGVSYYTTDTDQFRIVSDFRPGESWSYSGYSNIISYPMVFGTLKIDTFNKYQQAFGISCSQIDSFIADGYGMLMLPNGTTDTALRVHIFHSCAESVTRSGYPGYSYSRTEEYRWYVPGFHSPRLSMTYDITGLTPTMTSVEYYTKGRSATAVNDINESIEGLTISPNPAVNELHIKMDIKNAGQVSISATDMMGRLTAPVQQQYMYGGTADVRYNVSALPAGMYIIRVQTADGTAAKKIEITK